MIFAAMARSTLTVKRASNVDGVVGDPVVHISGLKCIPVVPSGVGRASSLAQANVVSTLFLTFETYVVGVHDIEAGDIVSISGIEYNVRGAAVWDSDAALVQDPYMHLTLERIVT